MRLKDDYDAGVWVATQPELGSVRLNDEWHTVPKDRLDVWLAGLPQPEGNVTAVDTEACGLYVDGLWSSEESDCQPKARVSIVSVAYRTVDGEYLTFAVPFDQGMIGGKQLRYSHERECFDVLDHSLPCFEYQADAPFPTPCVCAPWNFGEQAWKQLMLWLSDKRHVYHNAKYDLHILMAGLRLYSGTGFDFINQFAWDTLLCQALAEPLFSNALDEIGKRLFGEGKTDGMAEALSKQGTGLTKRYDLVSWWVAGIYAAQDTMLTIKLFYDQQTRIEEGHIDPCDRELIDVEFAKCRLLYKIENRGVGYNAEAMRAEATKMESMVAKLHDELPWVKLGKEATITQAKWWFFEHLNTVPVKLGNSCQVCGLNKVTGKRRKKKVPECAPGTCVMAPSLDAEVVGRLCEMAVDGADQYQLITNFQSALSKWYRAWPNQIGEDGRLRTNFYQCKTESDRKDKKTGGAISNRLSAERVQFQGFPNEERLPKDIKSPKKMIKAKDGHEVWEFDISNAEIRIAAWASGDPNLIEAVNSGKNIHDMNTQFIFADDLGGLGEEHDMWNEYRKLSKIGVFSDFYGSGIRTMQAQFQSGLKRSFPESRVRDFKSNLAAAYPLVKRLQKKAQMKADVTMGGDGYIKLYTGRRRWFGWGERTHKAMNQIMQCNVAEGVSRWMLEVEDEFPGMMINQVHDSLWMEIPTEKLTVVRERVPEIGVKIFENAFKGIMFKIDEKRLA